MMNYGWMVVWIIFIVFGSLSAPFSIWQIGRILRERRQDKMSEMQIKAKQQFDEMKLKAEMDAKILGGGSAVSENLTAELCALREEVHQMREELNRVKSQTDTNYIR